MLNPTCRAVLDAMDASHRRAKDRFYRCTAGRRAGLFVCIKQARNRLLDEIFDRINHVRGASPPLSRLQEEMYAYFERSDWALLDMIALAACTAAAVDKVAEAVASHALIYHSLRMLDDVLDSHYDYKGGSRTLLGELCADAATKGAASAGNLIPAMIIMASNCARLSTADRDLVERTLIGMLHESFSGSRCTLESYRAIAMAKMGAYGLFLYRPVLLLFDESARSKLETFLERTFFVSQVINDLQDQRDDQQRGQPNYWLIDTPANEALDALIGEIRWLSLACSRVVPSAMDYAHARLADLIGYLLHVSQHSDLVAARQ